MNPDACWRGDSIRIRICEDAETFKSGKKSLRIQKYPDMCGQGLVELNRNTVHVFFFLTIVVFLWIAVFVHLLAGQDSSKVACGGISRTTPLYQPKWCVSFCSIPYILSLVAVVTHISRQVKLLPDEKKVLPLIVASVVLVLVYHNCRSSKKKKNSEKFCVYTVFYFYKSSSLYPDLQALLFRRWSFGVLLWEIETGGEFCCLEPCHLAKVVLRIEIGNLENSKSSWKL